MKQPAGETMRTRGYLNGDISLTVQLCAFARLGCREANLQKSGPAPTIHTKGRTDRAQTLPSSTLSAMTAGGHEHMGVSASQIDRHSTQPRPPGGYFRGSLCSPLDQAVFPRVQHCFLPTISGPRELDGAVTGMVRFVVAACRKTRAPTRLVMGVQPREVSQGTSTKSEEAKDILAVPSVCQRRNARGSDYCPGRGRLPTVDDCGSFALTHARLCPGTDLF